MNIAGKFPQEDAIRAAAARWTVRRDRGLSAAESIEFELWLAANPQHATAMQRAGGAWARLDRMPENVARQALEAGRRRRHWWRAAVAAGSLAAAAAVVLWLRVAWLPESGPAVAATPSVAVSLQAAGPRLVTLADGTEVRLNAGGEITEQFSAAERSVWLARGEAHFTVTKDTARPFVVRAGALQVRAIGTAFNVNLGVAQAEVIVTEGRVAVATAEDGGGRTEVGSRRSEGGGQENAKRTERVRLRVAEIGAGERAVVTMAASPDGGGSAVVISRVAAVEISRALAWQEPLLRLGGATLAEVATGFEDRTGRRVILADPALAGLRLGGRFRADDIDGFVNLLATTLDIDVERAADGTLVLRKKVPNSR